MIEFGEEWTFYPLGVGILEKSIRVEVKTSRGRVVVELHPGYGAVLFQIDKEPLETAQVFPLAYSSQA